MDTSHDLKTLGLSEAGIQQAYGLLQTAVDADQLMGAALQVGRGGTALPVACFGKREQREGGAAVAADTIFLIASIVSGFVNISGTPFDPVSCCARAGAHAVRRSISVSFQNMLESGLRLKRRYGFSEQAGFAL